MFKLIIAFDCLEFYRAPFFIWRLNCSFRTWSLSMRHKIQLWTCDYVISFLISVWYIYRRLFLTQVHISYVSFVHFLIHIYTLFLESIKFDLDLGSARNFERVMENDLMLILYSWDSANFIFSRLWTLGMDQSSYLMFETIDTRYLLTTLRTIRVCFASFFHRFSSIAVKLRLAMPLSNISSAFFIYIFLLSYEPIEWSVSASCEVNGMPFTRRGKYLAVDLRFGTRPHYITSQITCIHPLHALHVNFSP